MAAKQCPNCRMWVTDEERMTGQCPGCQSFFESKLPGDAAHQPPAASGAPVINTHSHETPTQRAKRGAGAWSGWLLVPIIIIGMRACRAVLRTQDRGARPNYEQYDWDTANAESYDQERIRELLEQARQRSQRANEFTMGPADELASSETDVDPFDIESREPNPFESFTLPPGLEPELQDNGSSD